MAWIVEYTDEFGAWWDGLSEAAQTAVAAHVGLLEERGPALGRPHADTVKGSRHPNMKELRVQRAGRPLRVLYAFDLRRHAILLLGGEKTGKARWYRQYIPLADRLLDEYLAALKREGKNDG